VSRVAHGTTDVAVYVDRHFIASGKATHLNNLVAVLPLSGVAAYRALQIGHGLVLQTPAGTLTFSLSDTAKAMSAVLDCVKTLVEPQPSPQVPYQLLAQEATRGLLLNFLSAAGITGYRLGAPKQGDAGVSFTLADDTDGILRVEIGVGPTGADDRSTYVIGAVSNLCKSGQYLSGKESLPSTDGSVVRKVITSCRTGNSVKIVETTIIRHIDGALVQLSLILPANWGIDQPGNQDRDRAALVDAALRISHGR